MTYHVNTTTKSMYQCEKCAFKNTLTRDQICLVYKNNFPKNTKIYLCSCLHNYSLLSSLRSLHTYFVLLHFHEVCKYAKWFKAMFMQKYIFLHMCLYVQTIERFSFFSFFLTILYTNFLMLLSTILHMYRPPTPLLKQIYAYSLWAKSYVFK